MNGSRILQELCILKLTKRKVRFDLESGHLGTRIKPLPDESILLLCTRHSAGRLRHDLDAPLHGLDVVQPTEDEEGGVSNEG